MITLLKIIMIIILGFMGVEVYKFVFNGEDIDRVLVGLLYLFYLFHVIIVLFGIAIKVSLNVEVEK